MRLTELRVGLQCLFEFSFGLVELLLLHQNFATQIQGGGLIRIRCFRIINKFAGGDKIALLISLPRLLDP